MRRKRTIYFNDARHFYLFVFEPPMTMEDAWRPVDECAGTGVDTFVYGVSRDDGLFYPSKVGFRFQHGEHGPQSPGFRQAAYWRLWNNMQSLIDQGLDPLTVLIDRAHDKGMDFFASLRLGAYGDMDPAHRIANGGRGFVHPAVRDHQFAVLSELVNDYKTEGVELDFAAAPSGSARLLPPDDVDEHTSTLTEWVCKVADAVGGRSGSTPGQVGARVYPVEQMNLSAGVDVRTLLAEGALDYVMPMVYGYNLTDANMPIDWLIDAAHAADVSVYPLVQPDYHLEKERRFHIREHASPAMLRAAAANFWDKGADGMATWFLKWPLGDTERRILCEMGDPDLVMSATKHYFVNRNAPSAENAGFETILPVEVEAADVGTRHGVPFYIADDLEAAAGKVRQVLLKIRIHDLVSQDRVRFLLNGESLAGETCLRDFGDLAAPYNAMWLEFHLERVRPRKGENLLEFVLEGRAEGLISSLKIEDVEIVIEYGAYPSGFGVSSE
jgi:hypothetical protein